MKRTTWRTYRAANTEAETPGQFAVISAMTIAIAERIAADEGHATRFLSDTEAPDLDGRLRGYIYEVMLTMERLRVTDDRRTRDDLAAFLRGQAAIDGEQGDEIEPVSALRGAVRQAVRDFSSAAKLSSSQAITLETAAVRGAEGAYLSWETIGRQKSRERAASLAAMVPDDWELPKLRPELQLQPLFAGHAPPGIDVAKEGR